MSLKHSLLVAALLFSSGGLIAQTTTYCANSSQFTDSPTTPINSRVVPTPARYNIATVRDAISRQITTSNYVQVAGQPHLVAGSPMLMISVHRGLWQNAPENSNRAFYEGVAAGSEIVELDVRVTSDNVPIFMHDDDIARTTTGSGLAESNTATQFTSYYLRDRHGCPTNVSYTDLNGKTVPATNDKGTTFKSVLKAFVDDKQIYKDSNNNLRGTTLIVDPKGTKADLGNNFLTIMDVYNRLINDCDGDGTQYSVLAGAVHFKSRMFAFPADPRYFTQPFSCSAAAHSGGGWNATTNDFGLIPIILPEDIGHQTTLAAVAAGVGAAASPANWPAAINAANFPAGTNNSGGSTNFPAGDDIPFSYYMAYDYVYNRSASYTSTGFFNPLVMHFETNQSYNGDAIQPYRDYLTETGAQSGSANAVNRVFPVAGYAPDNFFPEGEPTGGKCCKTGETDYPWSLSSPTPAHGTFQNTTTQIANTVNAIGATINSYNYTYTPPSNAEYWPTYPLIYNNKNLATPLCVAGTTTGVSSGGTKSPGCLDYRGRYDFLMSTGMTVFTVERVPDVIAFATLLGLRDTNYLSTP